MNIKINSVIFEKFGNISMGAIMAHNLTISDLFLKEIQEKKIECVEKVNKKLKALGSVEAFECVHAWRNIFQMMGASTSRISSIENIYRFVLENGRLFDVNPIVDLYNSISCFWGLPMAGYDIHKISDSSLELRPAKKGEIFKPLGLKQVEKTKNGEIVYADNEKILCRYWNNKDSDLTKITKDSKDILFIFDSSPEVKRLDLDCAVNMLANVIEDNCPEATISTCVLDNELQEFSL